MRVSTSDRFEGWTRGLGLVALVALLVLAWSVLAPGGLFWTAVLAAGLVSSAATTVLLVHTRRVPSLAQVIASAEAEPVVGGDAQKA
jgi:hypothetical protein